MIALNFRHKYKIPNGFSKNVGSQRVYCPMFYIKKTKLSLLQEENDNFLRVSWAMYQHKTIL